jgi:hypothetical protein
VSGKRKCGAHVKVVLVKQFRALIKASKLSALIKASKLSTVCLGAKN